MTTLLEAARVVSSLIANRPLGGYWPELSRALTDLANEIAAAESAPAVVTAEEIAAVGANCDDWNKRHKYECKEGILEWRSADSEVAALVAERTAAAVEAARVEERERCALVADALADELRRSDEEMRPSGDEGRDLEAVGASWAGDRIRARGQSEAPAPAPAASTAAFDAADLDRLIAAIAAVVDRLHSGGPIVEHLEQADTDALHELWKCQTIATRLRDREAVLSVSAADAWRGTRTSLRDAPFVVTVTDSKGVVALRVTDVNWWETREHDRGVRLTCWVRRDDGAAGLRLDPILATAISGVLAIPADAPARADERAHRLRDVVAAAEFEGLPQEWIAALVSSLKGASWSGRRPRPERLRTRETELIARHSDLAVLMSERERALRAEVERLRAWERDARAAMEGVTEHGSECEEGPGMYAGCYECTCHVAALRAVLARKVGP